MTTIDNKSSNNLLLLIPFVIVIALLINLLFSSCSLAEPVGAGAESENETCSNLPQAHKASHQNDGTDEISVASLSGELVDDQPPKAHSASKVTSGRFLVDRLPAMTDEKIWKGTGANVEEVDAPIASIIDYGAIVASTNERNYNNSPKSTNSQSWVKLKETRLNADLAACKITFLLKRRNGGTAHGQIRKNGGIIGTNQQDSTGEWTAKIQDFSGFVTNDLIQIYGYVDTSDSFWCDIGYMNFAYDGDNNITHIAGNELISELPLVTDPTISMTNIQ